MNIIDIDMYLLFDTLRILVEALCYTAGLIVCFAAGFYIGNVVREYVDRSNDK